MKTQEEMNECINNFKGYVQNTATSISNISQRISIIEKKYQWGLKLHVCEAWAADINDTQDKEFLSKLNTKKDDIIFLKVKININCSTLKTFLFSKSSKPKSMSKTINLILDNEWIGGFSYVKTLTEGYSYAYMILALHVKEFANFKVPFKYLKEHQAKLVDHRRVRQNKDSSLSKKVDLSLLSEHEYAMIIEQIERTEIQLSNLKKQKISLEKKFKSKSQKIDTQWPMHEKEFNELLKIKKTLPLKNMQYRLFENPNNN